MMLTKKITINLGSITVEHYRKLGYMIPKFTSKTTWFLEVSVDDLPRTSTVKVKVSCEKCDKTRSVRYRDLHRTRKSVRGMDGKTYCKNCVKTIRIGNPLYHEYKKGARIRGLDFELTLGEFYDINKLPCHYCGGMNTYARVSYTGNGVDRMDNLIGYTKENCVPCCSVCNRGKGAMAYLDFIDYIERLRKHKWEN